MYSNDPLLYINTKLSEFGYISSIVERHIYAYKTYQINYVCKTKVTIQSEYFILCNTCRSKYKCFDVNNLIQIVSFLFIYYMNLQGFS